MNIAPSEELDAKERLRMLADACGKDPAVQWPRIALEAWERAEKECREWLVAAETVTESLNDLAKQTKETLGRVERENS